MATMSPLGQDVPGQTIIGLDPSIRRTGVARWRDGRLSTQTVVTNEKQPIEARMRWVCGHIWPLFTRDTFVVLEAPYISNNGKTSMMLAGLHYVIRYGLHARGVPFGVVSPTQLKKFACGDGNADKTSMVKTAVATFGPGADLQMGPWLPSWPIDDVDAVNDEADALQCLTLGLFHRHRELGKLLEPFEPGLSADQEQIYRTVARNWPELEWE